MPLLSDAYDTAKMLCEKYYLAAPKLKIEEFNSKISFIPPSVGSRCGIVVSPRVFSDYTGPVVKLSPAITTFAV